MPTTVRMTPILSSTIAAFKPALSLTPITSTTVMSRRDEHGRQVEPGHRRLPVGRA